MRFSRHRWSWRSPSTQGAHRLCRFLPWWLVLRAQGGFSLPHQQPAGCLEPSGLWECLRVSPFCQEWSQCAELQGHYTSSQRSGLGLTNTPREPEAPCFPKGAAGSRPLPGKAVLEQGFASEWAASCEAQAVPLPGPGLCPLSLRSHVKSLTSARLL